MDDIHSFNESKYITIDLINSINTNVSNICNSYDGQIDELIHEMKVSESKYHSEQNNLIQQFETKFQQERERRNKIDRIWIEKLLMHQIKNETIINEQEISSISI